MKRIAILAFVMLTACSDGGAGYQPKLSEQPKSTAKFEADRKACIAQANDRFDKAKPSEGDASILGGLGAVGAAAGVLVDRGINKQDDDYHKSFGQMANECLAKHGYKIAS